MLLFLVTFLAKVSNTITITLKSNLSYFYVTLWTCFSGKSGIKNARIYWQYKSTIYKTKCAFGLSICLGNPLTCLFF